jgi:hypothetical protein
MMTYLLILRFEWEKIPQDKHWSILTLKQFFTWRLIQSQSGSKKALNSKKDAA